MGVEEAAKRRYRLTAFSSVKPRGFELFLLLLSLFIAIFGTTLSEHLAYGAAALALLTVLVVGNTASLSARQLTMLRFSWLPAMSFAALITRGSLTGRLLLGGITAIMCALFLSATDGYIQMGFPHLVVKRPMSPAFKVQVRDIVGGRELSLRILRTLRLDQDALPTVSVVMRHRTWFTMLWCSHSLLLNVPRHQVEDFLHDLDSAIAESR